MVSSEVSGWVQAGLAGLIAALGSTYWAGQSNVAIADARTQIAQVATQQQSDHDKVVSLTTDVTQIRADATETKADVKTLLQRK